MYFLNINIMSISDSNLTQHEEQFSTDSNLTKMFLYVKYARSHHCKYKLAFECLFLRRYAN